MGYVTEFELTVDHPDDEAIIADFRNTYEYARKALTETGFHNEECTWYDHEKDLKEFSKKYPDVMFTMWGSGSDAGGDYWKHYVINGKGQLVSGEITYPEFDPEQLEE